MQVYSLEVYSIMDFEKGRDVTNSAVCWGVLGMGHLPCQHFHKIGICCIHMQFS